jgi:membrane-associated protease RseP (regulator of RpoE activity)
VVYVFGVILFALGICVSVALHEAGHLATAKMFGMKVRRYFVGFGPRIWSFRRGETEYGLKAIPLGGFCDIAGMTALDEVTPDEAPRAMWRYPVWKRTVVLAAGSVTHFILGFFVLYFLAVSLGLPNIARTPELSSISCAKDATSRAEYENLSCKPGDQTPAKDAGMQPGDVITAVDGKPVQTIEQVQAVVNKHEGKIGLTVDRGGRATPIEANVVQVKRPKMSASGAEVKKDGKVVLEDVGMIGVGFPTNYEYGALDGIPATLAFTGTMFEKTWEALLRFPERIPAVVESIFGGERDPDTPVSVVGASRIGGEAVEAGLWALFLLLLASLNFFIGVFNLLPLLPLDGGHIAVTWYEKVRDWVRRARGKPAGGPVDYTKLSMVTMVLVVIGGVVVLLTVTADIVNPIRIFPN